MKFRGHESFAIRKGWLYKGMSNVKKEPLIFQGAAGNSMDVLGIGANMVKALRYWLMAVGLTTEPKSGKRNQSFTKLGDLIYNNDRYAEEIGTLWLIHYKLACNEDEATAWYIFFNLFNKQEFDYDDFYSAVKKYLNMQEDSKFNSKDRNIADRSISDDFSCIVNTYVQRSKLNPAKVHPENNIDCPLGELGLVDVIDKKKGIYKKTIPKSENIPLLILLAVIICNAEGKKEIRISELQNKEKSIGKIFNLDSITLINALYKLDSLGYIKVIRTAGLDIINIQTDITFEECVEEYYDSLNR